MSKPHFRANTPKKGDFTQNGSRKFFLITPSYLDFALTKGLAKDQHKYAPKFSFLVPLTIINMIKKIY